MERIIKNNKTAEYYTLLSYNSQHGFAKERESVCPLRNCYSFLKRCTTSSVKLDEFRAVDVVYLGFAQAFDKVPRVRLGKKMEASALGGNLFRWIDN